jgi:hypothetical protein
MTSPSAIHDRFEPELGAPPTGRAADARRPEAAQNEAGRRWRRRDVLRGSLLLAALPVA